jgi:hypothetical protein
MAKYMVQVAKRDELWRPVKFFNGDDMLFKVTLKVLDRYGPNNLRFTDKDEKGSPEYQAKELARQEWISIYSCDLREGLNQQRSYVQAQMKYQALWWQRGKLIEKIPAPSTPAPPGGYLDLPHPNDMWKVVCRDFEQESDKGKDRQGYLRDLFDWWVADHVSACAGSKYWSQKAQRTACVSSYMFQDEDGSEKIGVTASTEALAFIMYENCYDKWKEMHKFKEVEHETIDVPKYSGRRPEETKRWKCKWSDPSGGQDLYGGWDSEGLKQFEEGRKQITKSRKDHAEDYAKIEEAQRKRFAEKYDAEMKKKRKKKDGEDGEPVAATAKRPKKAQKNKDTALSIEYDNI